MRSGDKNTLLEITIKSGKTFSKIEEQLGEGYYFKGEVLSNIDFAWLPLLNRAEIIIKNTYFNLLAEFPKVIRWESELSKSNLYQKSIPEDFEKSSRTFTYLIKPTWGKLRTV